MLKQCIELYVRQSEESPECVDINASLCSVIRTFPVLAYIIQPNISLQSPECITCTLDRGSSVNWLAKGGVNRALFSEPKDSSQSSLPPSDGLKILCKYSSRWAKLSTSHNSVSLHIEFCRICKEMVSLKVRARHFNQMQRSHVLCLYRSYVRNTCELFVQ